MAAECKLRNGVMNDEKNISRYMGEGEILHLALKDDIGLFSVPVNYVYTDGKIYIHSSKRGRKIEALRNGGEIGFSMVISHRVIRNEEACKWGCAFKSVIGSGVPRILDEHEKEGALGKLMQHYGAEEWEFKPASLKATEVVEIMVTSISARVISKE